MRGILPVRSIICILLMSFLILVLVPCEESCAGEFFLFKISKKIVRGVGKVVEKTANGLGGIARGTIKVARKIDHGKTKFIRFTQRIIPRPIRRLTNPIIAKTIDKGFLVINPHILIATKVSQKIDKVNKLKKARVEARKLAENMKEWGNELKEKTKESVLILRRNKLIKPREEIRVFEKVNRIKIEMDKAADKIEKSAGKITLGNILGTVVDAGGVLGGKSGDIFKKLGKPVVKAVLTGTIRNMRPLDVAKQRLGDEIVKVARYKVFSGMSESRQKKIQNFLQLKNSKIKIKITPEGLKELIERGKVTKIVKDSIKKGKGLKINKPSDVNDIVKDILKDTAKSAYKKALKEVPEDLIRDVIKDAIIRKYPERKEEIKKVFKDLPRFDELRKKISKELEGEGKNNTKKILPTIVSSSDINMSKSSKSSKPDIVSGSQLTQDQRPSKVLGKGQEDGKEEQLKIIEIMADTEPVIYEKKGYRRLINIEGVVVKAEISDGTIKLITGSKALSLLVSSGYFVKFAPLGYVSSEKYDELYCPGKPAIPGQPKPVSDKEIVEEEEDLDLTGIMSGVSEGLNCPGAGSANTFQPGKVINTSREEDSIIWKPIQQGKRR